jgi:phage replication-related protein YjqB (UPF0714/DUF867 family)
VGVWVAETEPDPSLPLDNVSGKQIATIAAGLPRQRADEMASALREQGYPVLLSASVLGLEGGARRYAVKLSGLGSAAEAELMRQKLRAELTDRSVLPR